MTTLQTRLKYVLKDTGLSAKSASVKAGLSSYFIQNLFRHPDQSPSVRNTVQLAEALKVDFLWLVTGEAKSIDPVQRGEFDSELLEAVLTGVEQGLADENEMLPQSIKAKIIAQVYSHFVRYPEDAQQPETVEALVRGQFLLAGNG